MTDFYQFHFLTAYPASNLNRDDLGSPKSVVIGGTQRLRISSQALKRAWRTSSIFQEVLQGNLGIRTKEVGAYVSKKAEELKVNSKEATELGKKLIALLGGERSEKGKKQKNAKSDNTESSSDDAQTGQLVFLGVHELQAIDDLIKKLGSDDSKSVTDEDINSVLKKGAGGVDVAMFGRMLASKQDYNVEAAVQVAHAFTVQKSAIEDDYFTAVDDLGKSFDKDGSAHIGVIEYGAGLFYSYVCVDMDRLVANLNKDRALAKAGLRALVEAAATVSPTGKQNSFASRAYASYVLAERGNKQPRSLSTAFIKSISGADVLSESIREIENTYKSFDAAYGACADRRETMNVVMKQGSLKNILEFIE